MACQGNSKTIYCRDKFCSDLVKSHFVLDDISPPMGEKPENRLTYFSGNLILLRAFAQI